MNRRSEQSENKYKKNPKRPDDVASKGRWISQLNRKRTIALITAAIVLASGIIVAYEMQLQGSGRNFRSGTSPGNSALPNSIGDFSKESGASYSPVGNINVLFIGSQACPFCAAESWSIYLALSSLGGKWTDLSFIYSNRSDIFPDTPGLNFANATYSGGGITFHGYEISNRNWTPYQKLNNTNDALFNQYDQKNDIPFMLIGGVYGHTGSSYPPSILANVTGGTVMQWLKGGVDNSITEHIANESKVISQVISQLQGDSGSQSAA